MRLAWSVTVATVLACVLAGCSGDPEEQPEDSTPSFGGTNGTTATPPGTTTQPPTGRASPTPVAVDPTVDPQTATHPEVVYLIMKGTDNWTWFCTATLLASKVAVTAAHCLEKSKFISWEVVSPTLAGRPRVKAANVFLYNEKFNDVANPDIGIVVLESAIELTQYGELTDVSAKVDGGQDVQVGAIVRTAEQPEAPFKRTGFMKVTSTEKYGYTDGYGVPMYSHGGDSGAGMFLVENGQLSHKVVGIERQPDPQRRIDHLSRVDAAFITWMHSTSGQ